MTNEKQYSLSIRVDTVNPVHVTYSIFDALIPLGAKHEDFTRARCGIEICTTTEAFPHLIQQVKPHIITAARNCENDTNALISDWYEFQEARGEWDYHKWIRKD